MSSSPPSRQRSRNFPPGLSAGKTKHRSPPPPRDPSSPPQRGFFLIFFFFFNFFYLGSAAGRGSARGSHARLPGAAPGAALWSRSAGPAALIGHGETGPGAGRGRGWGWEEEGAGKRAGAGGKNKLSPPPGLLCNYFFIFFLRGWRKGKGKPSPVFPGRCCFSFPSSLPSPEKLQPSCQALLGKQQQQQRERVQGSPQQFTLAAAFA